MKTKKSISVIAASLLAMTSFAALAVTANAEEYDARNLNVGDILYPEDTIVITGGYEKVPRLWIRYQDDDWFCFGDSNFTLTGYYKWYKISDYTYEEEHSEMDELGEMMLWFAEECLISVVTNVTSVSFDKQELTLAVGDSETLVTNVGPKWAENRNYTLSSSDPSVAAIDDNGTVTAVSLGTATITATSDEDSTIVGTCAVTVTKKPAAASCEQVAEYPAQFADDMAASVWKVAVTPGTDTINSLSVKVNGFSPRDGKTIEGNFTDAEVVFGVVVTAEASEVTNITAVANGEDIVTSLTKKEEE